MYSVSQSGAEIDLLTYMKLVNNPVSVELSFVPDRNPQSNIWAIIK